MASYFVPPLHTPHTPASNLPPVIPTLQPNMNGNQQQQQQQPPAWAQGPANPNQYPIFPSSAVQNAYAAPNPHPRSYIPVPTSTGIHPPLNPDGTSVDFMGYPDSSETPTFDPASLQPDPSGATGESSMRRPQAYQRSHSRGRAPPAVPMAGAPGFGMFTPGSQPWSGTVQPTQLPWAAPYGASPYTAPMHAPPPEWAGLSSAAGPTPPWPNGAWNNQPGFPPVSPVAPPGAQYTPGGHPGVPFIPAGPAPPNGTGMARPHIHGGRGGQEPIHIPEFSPGPSYGPVLHPILAHKAEVELKINPLLKPMEPTTDQPYLKWDMLFPPNMVQRSDDPGQLSWMRGRDEPATVPRVLSLRILVQPSVGYPWQFEIVARDMSVGVTCGEVISGISSDLWKESSEQEYFAATRTKRALLGKSHRFNRTVNPQVPGGALGPGMKRLDWLGDVSRFDGLVCDAETIRRVWGFRMPCALVLKAGQKYMLSHNEISEQQQRARAANEGAGRSRSRAQRPMRSPQPPTPPASDYSDSESESGSDD